MKIKKFEFNMFPVNCYVLSDETKEAVIIDAGCFYEEEKQALKRYIFLMARVLRAIGSQTYVIVPGLVPAKIHPLDLLRLFPGFDASAGMDRRQFFQPPDRKY